MEENECRYVLRNFHIRKLYEFVCTLLHCSMYFEVHDDVEWLDCERMLGIHHSFLCTLHLPPTQQRGGMHGRVFLSEWYRLLTPVIEDTKYDRKSLLDRTFFLGGISTENHHFFLAHAEMIPDLVFLPVYDMSMNPESPFLYASMSIADETFEYMSPILTLALEKTTTCHLPNQVHCTRRIDFLKVCTDRIAQTARIEPLEDVAADFEALTFVSRRSEGVPWFPSHGSADPDRPVGFVNRTTWNRICSILKSDLFYARGHTYTRRNQFCLSLPSTRETAVTQGMRLYSVRGGFRVPYLWALFPSTDAAVLESVSSAMEGLSFLDEPSPDAPASAASTSHVLETSYEIPRALRPMQNYDIFAIRNECILVWTADFIESVEFSALLYQLEQLVLFGATQCILTGGSDLYIPLDAIGVTVWKYMGHAFDKTRCTDFVEARVWVFDIRLVCTQMRSQVGFIAGVTLIDEHISSQVLSALPPSDCYAKPLSRQILTTTAREEHFLHAFFGFEYRLFVSSGELQVWIANNLVYLYDVERNTAVILTNGRIHLNGMSPRMLSPREQLLRLGPRERGSCLALHRMEAWYSCHPATPPPLLKTADEPGAPSSDAHSTGSSADASETV